MSIKWIGAILIICSCGFVGFKISKSYRLEEQNLRQLMGALDYMVCELRYKQSALPDICFQIGTERKGCIGKLFENLSRELNARTSPDVQSSLASAAASAGEISRRVEEAICIMGSSLGRFDLDGQLLGLESVRTYCQEQLRTMAKDRDARLRSYQTLGVCAGAALAILFVYIWKLI